MNFHVAQDLRAAMAMSRPERFDLFEKGTSLREIERAIMLAYNKGYDVIPPCNNVTERGLCAGHEENES